MIEICKYVFMFLLKNPACKELRLKGLLTAGTSNAYDYVTGISFGDVILNGPQPAVEPQPVVVKPDDEAKAPKAVAADESHSTSSGSDDEATQPQTAVSQAVTINSDHAELFLR